MKLNQLQEIRQIGYLRVKFAAYEGRKEPCICPNCLRPSHGSSYCGMPPRCVKCGGDHSSNTCPERLDKGDPKSRIPNEKVKCANCGGPHPATFRGCPEIREYVKIQNISRKRNTNNRTQQTRVPSLNSFPPLNPLNIQPHLTGSSHQTNKLWSQIVNEPPHTNNLLTMSEALGLFQGLYNRLSQCRTKLEQGTVILEYTMSLMNDNGSQ